MHMKLFAMAAIAAATGAMNGTAARACAFSPGAGWTAQGGGTPAQLVVLGGETCSGNVHGDGLQIIAPPQHGKVRVTGSSSYVYTPNRAYRGPDVIGVSTRIASVGLVIGTVVVTVE